MGQAADRLGRVGRNLRMLPDEAIASGNRRVRARVLVALKEDAGSDRSLSGIGPRGVPLKVTTTKRSTGNGRVVTGRVMAGPARQRAPWFWLEEGTDAGPRRRRAGRGRNRVAGRPASFLHPGTPAKRTWSRGVGPVLPEVRKDIERLYREALKG